MILLISQDNNIEEIDLCNKNTLTYLTNLCKNKGIGKIKLVDTISIDKNYIKIYYYNKWHLPEI